MSSRARASGLHLQGYLDGNPVECTILLQAVRDGAISDLNRVQVALSRQGNLSSVNLPVPEELQEYSPVASESFGREDRSWD